MQNKLKLAAVIIALSASSAIADGVTASVGSKGVEQSGGVAFRAKEQGTLHPGHVAVFATGKNGEQKYNTPAYDFHEDGTAYATGPGGYGAQQSGRD